MKQISRYLFLICLLTSGCAMQPTLSPKSPSKNLVLFIGDGMGQTVITATRVQFAGANGQLYMDQLPYTGLSKTYCSNQVVTDSAAGATAIATGQKTNYAVISQDSQAIPDNKGMYKGMTPKQGRDLVTIAELAKKSGKSVGIVSSARITHATPAAFYAHINNRRNEKAIAQQLLNSNFDLFLGGGLKIFKGMENKLKNKFLVVKNKKDLDSIQSLEKPVVGLFTQSHLTFVGSHNKGSGEPKLSDLTEAAIRLLSKNPKGFFLMVEGARIDHAGHGGRAVDMILETREFDHSIGKALSLLNENSSTLIVTADHETGGVALNAHLDRKMGPLLKNPKNPTDFEPRYSHSKNLYKKSIKSYPIFSFSTGPTSKNTPKMKNAAHTGVDVPVYAWGKNASIIHGTMENTEIFKKMKSMLGL